MKRQKEQLGVRVVRAALLAGLVIFLGVVAALFVARRSDVAPRPVAGPEDPFERILDRVAAGEGFDYEVTEGDRSLFHITADRVVTSRDGVYELEGVAIRSENRSGVTYVIEAQRARYRERGREKLTTLEGGAVARSSNGAEISSEGFELRRGGRLISSMAPVEYRLSGRLTGSARRFDAYLEDDRYQFAGTVRIDTVGPAPTTSLRCQRLSYEEAEQRIIADGGVILERGDDEVEADRMSALLAADGSGVEFVNARWNVAGHHVLGGDLGARIDFTADQIAVEYDAATGAPRRAQFEVEPGGRVVFEASDDSGLARRMVASFVLADFEGGLLRRAEADAPVEIREYLRHAPEALLLSSCSQRATAEFGSSGLTALELVERVTLHRPTLQATGDRLTLGQDEGLLTVRGAPAEVHAERGRLTAPRITYRSGSGRLEATGGVRAELARGSGFAMLRDRDDEVEPIRVTSERAGWDTERRDFEFEGEVRAWQGEDFVVAEVLEGTSGGEVLTATGGVKTVVAQRDPGEGDEPGAESSPVEVTAGKLAYRRADRVVVYSESPVARQAGRVLKCQDLRLFLTEGSDLERLVCEGTASIEDPKANRSVRGDRAEYRPAAALVEVSGEPAVLKHPDGHEVRGPVVVYDLERGTARVSTRAGASSDRSEPDS